MDVEDAEIGAESSINRDDEEDSAYVQSEAPGHYPSLVDLMRFLSYIFLNLVYLPLKL